MNFKELNDLLNQIFMDIVEVITQILNINENQVKEILASYKFIDENIEGFVGNVTKKINDIRDTLFAKTSDVDIEKLRKDIEVSTHRFMEIADDLELLSLNTICKTKKLGKEKLVISRISDEIKKNSNYAKAILKDVQNNFYSIYEKFSYIVSFFSSLKEIELKEVDKDIEKVHDIKITADISEILQYSQFHDIFRQQLEKIEKAYFSINWQDNSLFELGRKFKFYEQALSLLEEMRGELDKVLDDIVTKLKDFLYNLNTDVQNLFSKIGLVSYSFDSMNKVEKQLFESIKSLKKECEELNELLKKSNDFVDNLIKFRKNFYNLRVITSVEVNRFGIPELFSLTDSMDSTYNNLQDLIDKVLDSIKVWQKLAKEINDIVNNSYESMESYHRSSVKEDFEKVKDKNKDIDDSLQSLKRLLEEKDFLVQLETYKTKLLDSLDNMISLLRKEFDDLNLKIDSEIMEQPDFNQGYSSWEIEVIKNVATEEEPAIELF